MENYIIIGAILVAIGAVNIIVLNRVSKRLEVIEEQEREIAAVLDVVQRYADEYNSIMETIVILKRFELPSKAVEDLNLFIETTDKFVNLMKEIDKDGPEA